MRQRQHEFEVDCGRLLQNDPTLLLLTAPQMTTEYRGAHYLLLGRSLVDNTHLVTLSLQQPVLFEEPARALAKGIAQSNLKHLSLDYGSWEDQDEVEHIWKILIDGIKLSKSIETISFETCFIECSALEQVSTGLSVMSNLRDISIGGTAEDIDVLDSDEEVVFISQILTKTASLSSLRLQHARIGIVGMSLLALGLRCNSTVTTLSLQNCFINDQQVALFLNFWQCNSSPIRYLHLDNNEIHSSGAQQLIRAVTAHSSSIRRLSLDCNKCMYNEDLMMIGEWLYGQPLSHPFEISLAGDYNLVRFANPNRAASQQAGRALLHAVQQNVYITEMGIRNTLHHPRDKAQLVPLPIENEIVFYANLNKMGRFLLSTNHHGLPSTIWCYIFAKCQSEPVQHNTTSLIHYFLCEQPSLVCIK